jgi:amino acid adenylation domain-containing protein
MENLVGIFLNNLVLRSDLSGDHTFRELLTQVRQTALDAYIHQEIPFELLLEELSVERDLSRTPLFQLLFNMLNLADSSLYLPDIQVKYLFPVNPEANFDLTLYATELTNGLYLQLVYNTDLFNADRMVIFLQQYCHLLAQIAAQPDLPLTAYTLITSDAEPSLPDPTKPLFESWSGAIHDLVSAQAAKTPHLVAVRDAATSWTYAELESRSNQLAHTLRESGIHNQDVVAIYANRSASLVWAMLGVLKAGAAFLLLDAAYPPARLRGYLETAKPRGWIALATAVPLPSTLSEWVSQSDLACDLTLPQQQTAVPAIIAQQPLTAPKVVVGPDDLAYVVFTSGTTGTPKGILGRHSPLAHFFPWQANTFGLTDSDRFSMLSGLAHDPLLRDIFTPLIVGATLFIPAQTEMLQPGKLAAWLAHNQITVAHLTPALGQVAATTVPDQPAPNLPALRYAFFGGDRLTGHHVHSLQILAPKVTCVNFYGTTETPQAMAYHIVSSANGSRVASEKPVPLGRGIDNVDLLILNANRQMTGIGELGEIYVRTPYLTKGYLQADSLTMERFVPNPLRTDTADLLYRTGDLGRYLPNGLVTFAGRADRQVKIRGFRIELAEIEAALAQLDGVQQCAVLAHGADVSAVQLVAYIVGAAKRPSTTDLRAALTKIVPDYMIPAFFIELEELPLTPNGKLDTNRLPAPDDASLTHPNKYTPPTDLLENELVNIWENVLKVQPIGIHDNYFELGGHSLQTIALFAQMERAFNKNIPLALIFEAPTIAQLAAVLREKGEKSEWSVVVPISPGGSKRPFFCVHGGAGHVYHFRGIARHLSPDQPFYGLQPRALNALPNHYSNIPRMAADYVKEIRKVQPHGPYYLGGFCFGGIVAFEMARQLTKMEEAVALVAIIDSVSPNYKSSQPTSIPPKPKGTLWQRHTVALKKHQSVQSKLVYLAKRVKGRSLVMLARFKPARKRLEKRYYRFLIRWHWVTKRPLPLWLNNIQLLEINRHARKQYQPTPYSEELTVFRQFSKEDESTIPPHLGWASLTSKTVHVYEIEGEHLALLQEPNVQELAKYLQASLDASRAKYEVEV